MAALPLVRIGHLDGPVGFLSQVGAPVERLLSRVSLPTLALGDADAFVASRLVYRFLDLASEAEGVFDLGVRSALAVEIGRDPWTGAALATGGTLRDVLECLTVRARAESSGMHLSLRETPAASWLEYRGSGDFATGGVFGEQYMVVLLTAFVRKALGATFSPPVVWLQGPDADALERLPMFSSSRFVPRRIVTRVVVPRDLLDRQLDTAVIEVPRRSGYPPASLVSELRRVLAPYLSQGLPGIHLAAEMTGTSVRSLQRRLDDAGMTYSQLTDQLRRARAIDLVGTTASILTEVALEVGFSDAAHFTRAFRRWTGMTPTAYRRAYVPDPGFER